MVDVPGPVEIPLEGEPPGRRGTPVPDDETPGPSRPARSLPPSTLVVAVGVLFVGLVIGIVVGRSGGGDGADVEADPPATSVATTAPPVTTIAEDPALEVLPEPGSDRDQTSSGVGGSPPATSTVPDEPAVAFDDLGVALMPEPTGLVVVGYSRDGKLVEIDLDRGTVRRTRVDLRPTMGQYEVTALDEVTVVRSPGTAPGSALVVVPRGGVSRSGADAGDDAWLPLVPGSGPREVWLGSSRIGPVTTLQQVDVLSGDVSGRSFEIGWNTTIGRDPAGGLLLVAQVGGSYRVLDDEVTRITTGRVVAAGSDHLVVSECDERFECGTWLVDRVSGSRAQVPDDGQWSRSMWVGLLSPDGAMALSFEPWSGFSDRSYVLRDVDTGDTLDVSLPVGGDFSPGPDVMAAFAWTPDSRYLIHLQGRRLSSLDTVDGTVTSIGGEPSGSDEPMIPDLLTFDVRSAEIPMVPPLSRPVTD